MDVLTQEMFDKRLNEFLNKLDDVYINITYDECCSIVTFKDYLVKNICSSIETLMTITFENCIIENITISDPIIFKNCKIVGHLNNCDIELCSFENCTAMTNIPLVCPENGEFIGYKKCNYWDKKTYSYRYCVVKLLIPPDAKRSSAFRRKCRCNKAKVLGAFNLDGSELTNVERIKSILNYNFIYTVGEWVYPDKFDEDRFNECSHGIHFFMTFEEAKDYNFN